MGATSSTEESRAKEKSKKKKKKPFEAAVVEDKAASERGEVGEVGEPAAPAWPPGCPPRVGAETLWRPEEPAAEPPAPPAEPPAPPAVGPEPERHSFGIFGTVGESSRAYGYEAPSPAFGSAGASRAALQVRVLRAQGVRLQCSGLANDVPEPFVLVRLGRQSFRTGGAERLADPEWTEDHEHTFSLPDEATSLELQLMSGKEVVGRASVAIHPDVPGWQAHRLPLQSKGGRAHLEFETRVLPDGVQAQGPEPDALEYHGPRLFQAESTALPWRGVRVLELARRTWSVALCGRLMALHGAEVIRVPPPEPAQEVAPNAVPKQLHRGKYLATYDLKDAQQLAKMKAELLSGCSLFLTDLPADELDAMELGAASLRQQCPWLIFVHGSSVGMLADTKSASGVNDAGAFFSLSGLAEQLGHFLGPQGLAAACAGSALFGVSCLAVLRRRCGCPGDRVEASVFRAGRWCSALGALTGWARAARPELRADVEVQAAPEAPWAVEGVAMQRLTKCKATKPRWSLLEPSVLLPPVTSECPIASELPLARVSVIELSDEYQVSALALGALLADLGARVTKLERPQRPDPWLRSCPQLYKDLSARKTVQKVNYSGVGGTDASGRPLPGQAALYRSLAKATMMITNLPPAALESWGLEPKRLREMFPHLILVQISTWGSDARGRHQEMASRKGGQEVYAFWEASGLAQLCNGASMPPGLSELVCSQQALAAVGLALLRQQRTQQGQLVQLSRHLCGLFCHSLAALEPPEPLQSPLLQTLDGRFLRLLGKGHQPYEAYVLLHALGQRESLAQHVGGSLEKARAKLRSFTWEDLQRHQDELLATARQWSFEDLSKAFQEKGIEWFVEEMRPMDAEALHRQRAEQLEELRRKQQDAAQRALQMAQKCTEVQQELQARQEEAHDELCDRLLEQNEQQRKMEALREQYKTQVPPVVGVTLDGAKGLVSPTRGARITPYCVVEVVGKPYTRLQTAALEGTKPMWDYTGVVQSYGFGDVLKLAVFHKEEVLEADPEAPKSLEHTTVLYLQVAAGYNLLNRDSGIMGDVSDPYVVAQLGDMVQQTPAVSNQLNPVWKERNQFAFTVVHQELDRYLLLEVLNSNTMKDDGLGRLKLDTRSIEPGQWHHYRLKLEEGQGGELEFDVYLKPAEPCKPHGHQDELLGQAEIPMSQFYPHGWEGTVPLFLNSKPTEGTCDVFLEVEPQGVKLNRPFRRGADVRTRRTMSSLSLGSRRSSGGVGLARTRSQVSEASESPPARQNLGESEKSVLQLRVNQALNLTNRDSGLFGDVSDPYVVVRCGGRSEKTKVVNNDLNPVWQDNNLFNFAVAFDEHKLELEVMDANHLKDVSLGKCELDLRAVEQGLWSRFSEKLVGGLKGELSFDLFFKATEYRRLATEHSSTLHVRVNNARNLPNTDSGVLGDVSDPYVVLSVGELTRRTPTVDNNLNPDWQAGNLFTFAVEEQDAVLHLEVMNANVVTDDRLGEATVAIGHLETKTWCRLVEDLGQHATLELDVFFQPNEQYHLNHELRQVKEEETKSMAEAKRLSQEVVMAERAQKWLRDVDENTKMPMSLEEREWQSACGGRNFVAPAWITVTQTQVEALVRQREEQPRPVALFPEASPLVQQPMCRLKILSAFGLAPTRGTVAYCTCEIPLKKESRISTEPVEVRANPEWRFSSLVRGYSPGDALVLEVYSHEGQEDMTPRADELLGRAFLPGEKFYPEGFDGLLSLTLGPRPTGASLRVTALVD